jgi:hypothetical protein
MFDWRHFAGIGVFLAVWGAWQAPYTIEMGLAASKQMYCYDVGLRFLDFRWTTIVAHLFGYPLKVLVCLLPWSVLLMAYFDRDFRARIAFARRHVLYLLLAIGVATSTMLAAPQAKTRYLMPLYPCFAVLIGLVVDACVKDAAEHNQAGGWLGLSAVFFVAGLTICVVSFSPLNYLPWAQDKLFAAVYFCAAVALACVTYLAGRRTVSARWGILAVCVFLGLSYRGAVVNALIRAGEDTPAAVAKLKKQLPEDVNLVSLGDDSQPIDHLFAFYYARPIAQIPWPPPPDRPAAAFEYFCFVKNSPVAERIDFPWEKVAEISCDRVHYDTPRRVVVVGRRLADAGEKTPRLRD